MKVKFNCANPDETEFTAHISMTMKEWKELRQLVDGSIWPGSKMTSMIFEMVAAAEKYFYKSDDE